MEYTKTVWKDLPDTSTPITASNLNNIEDGVEYLFEHGVGGGDTLPIGIILPLSTDTIPEGYLLCDGSAISRATYATLFSVIGTTYGSGDGSTTFNLPNLKGKTLVGQDLTDADFDTLGETGGEKEHTLTIAEIPSHNHSLPNVYGDFSGDRLTQPSDTFQWFNKTSGTGNTGGGQSHNNLQPYTVVKYIIKALNAQNGEVRSESLPVGTEIDFDGTAQDIPTGWTQVTPTQQVLWTNSDPTQPIGQSGLTMLLSSSDYDILEIFFNQRSHTNYWCYSIRFKKSDYGTRCYIPSTDGNIYRNVSKISDTEFFVSEVIGSSQGDTSLVIPTHVVGYKTGLFN